MAAKTDSVRWGSRWRVILFRIAAGCSYSLQICSIILSNFPLCNMRIHSLSLDLNEETQNLVLKQKCDPHFLHAKETQPCYRLS